MATLLTKVSLRPSKKTPEEQPPTPSPRRGFLGLLTPRPAQAAPTTRQLFERSRLSAPVRATPVPRQKPEDFIKLGEEALAAPAAPVAPVAPTPARETSTQKAMRRLAILVPQAKQARKEAESFTGLRGLGRLITKEIPKAFRGLLDPTTELQPEYQKLYEEFKDKGVSDEQIKTHIRTLVTRRIGPLGERPDPFAPLPSVTVDIENGRVKLSSQAVGFDVGVLERVGGKLTRTAINRISRINVVDDIFKLLKKEVPEVPATVLRKASQAVKDITDPTQVRRTINTVLKESAEEVERVGVQPLVQEARKFKTAKEFIASQEMRQTLRGARGMTAEDIVKKYPDIQLKREVLARDIHGNKVKILKGEALTPYELKGNKILLQDGKTYIVSKSQFSNIKGQSIKGEAKAFAPELEGLEESVKTMEKTRKVTKEFDNLLDERNKYKQGTEEYKKITEKLEESERGNFKPKFDEYQLPGGKNYEEILIQAPKRKPSFEGFSITKLDYETPKPYRADSPHATSHHATRAEAEKSLEGMKEVYGEIQVESKTFKSPHWEEPNILSSLRLNQRAYKGKKVTFMEELQSDWASAWRKRKSQTEFDLADPDDYGEIPFHPLIKSNKWQEPSVKRALKEAVDDNSKYFAWITGEQTSARYNLATKVKEVSWRIDNTGKKSIFLDAKEGRAVNFTVDKKGVVSDTAKSIPTDWRGKRLDEVLGKGLADKIMGKPTGTLSGKGLEFGGEWANNLYDKQVKNIVQDVTGGKVVKMKMGLPIEKPAPFRWLHNNIEFTEQIPKVGTEVTRVPLKQGFGGEQTYIITDVLGNGKFKAVLEDIYVDATEKGTYNRISRTDTLKDFLERNKEEFNISFKTTTQQGIKLTPEIIAKIKGAAPRIKTSGEQFAPELTRKELTDIFNQAKRVEVPVRRPPTVERLGIAPPAARKIERGEDVLLRERLRAEARGARAGKRELPERKAARMELQATINRLGLKKWENVRAAMELPRSLRAMSPEQMGQLESVLKQYKTADEFLPTRMLETLTQTELAGLRTDREVLEFLAKKKGLTVEAVSKIKPTDFGKFKFMRDPVLARQNPFFLAKNSSTSLSVLKPANSV